MKPGRAFAVTSLAPLVLVSFASCNNQFRFDSTLPPVDAGPAPCTVDTDCRLATLHCDPNAGVCVECVNDAQCTTAGLTRCDLATQVCAGCKVDGDCAHGQLCETTTGTCLFTCIEDPTCPLEAPACDEVRGVCIRCKHNRDCARDEPFCEAVSGRCLSCLNDDDCPVATPRCDRPLGGCVVCITSGDCTAPAMCDPSAHDCK